MKQNISSGMFIAIIAVVVVIAAGVCLWVFRAPAAVAVGADPDAALSGGGGASATKLRNDEMRAGHAAPTADQRQQIEEWKKAHPDATTKQ